MAIRFQEGSLAASDGHFSEMGSLVGYPKYKGPPHNRNPTTNPSLENGPDEFLGVQDSVFHGFRRLDLPNLKPPNPEP